MKWLIAIILIPNFVFSQKDTTISLKNNTNNLVKWNTDFNFTTNGLNQSFLNSFTKGGYISDNIKNKWLDLSKENNHATMCLVNLKDASVTVEKQNNIDESRGYFSIELKNKPAEIKGDSG